MIRWGLNGPLEVETRYLLPRKKSFYILFSMCQPAVFSRILKSVPYWISIIISFIFISSFIITRFWHVSVFIWIFQLLYSIIIPEGSVPYWVRIGNRYPTSSPLEYTNSSLTMLSETKSYMKMSKIFTIIKYFLWQF